MQHKTQRVIVDIDGVCSLFTNAYASLLAYEAGGCKLPKGWQDDPTFPNCWNWEAQYGYDAATVKRVWEDHILAKDDFWRKLEPLPGTHYAMRRLNWLANDGLAEVYFLTHRMGNKAKLQTEKWLYDKGGIDYPTVIISGPEKLPLLRDLKPDFFIDDRQETMLELVKAAEHERWLEGKNYFLKTAPYNKSAAHPKLKRADSLEDALTKAGLWA